MVYSQCLNHIIVFFEMVIHVFFFFLAQSKENKEVCPNEEDD